MRSFVQTHDFFFPRATSLRRHFESRFANPRSTAGDRFVWDLWNVPGQYTALRTPAWEYFPREIYDDFHQRLVWWGRRTLGCHDVSPPWLSCYVNGCGQELHADQPHGPFAFVYSLTPWTRRNFRGGETLLLRDGVLDYWTQGAAGRGLERAGIEREVAPRFNRLTVFDPRVPHGVRRVEGGMDPREGRLVIHGWFVNPRPFVEGPLGPAELQRAIESLMAALDTELSRVGGRGALQGLLNFRARVTPSGRVNAVATLVNTLRNGGGDPRLVKHLERFVGAYLRARSFRSRRAGSHFTLPVLFEEKGFSS